MSARDADAGRNADIMYFFTSSQFNFDLDPFTGEIRSKQVFDREQASKYSLTVQVNILNKITEILNYLRSSGSVLL